MWLQDILPILLSRLDPNSSNFFALDGAMIALKLICEDSSEKLAMTSILDGLIPKLIMFMNYPNDPKIRQKSIECMNSLLYLMPSSTSGTTTRSTSVSSGIESGNNSPECGKSKISGKSSILLHMNQFLTNLAGLSTDSDGNVRKVICQSLVILASLYFSLLSTSYDSICQFMLNSLNDNEENVRIEACEFWFTLSRHVQDNSASPEIITKYFSILIPILIHSLILSDEKLQFDRMEDEDENKLNLKPLFTHGQGMIYIDIIMCRY